MVQAADDVHEPNRIDIENRGRIRIVSHLRRIAGNADQIPDSHRCSPKQVALDAQHVPITAGVVQDGIDADLALNEQ